MIKRCVQHGTMTELENIDQLEALIAIANMFEVPVQELVRQENFS